LCVVQITTKKERTYNYFSINVTEIRNRRQHNKGAMIELVTKRKVTAHYRAKYWTTYITQTKVLNHIHNIHLHNKDDGGQAIGEEL